MDGACWKNSEKRIIEIPGLMNGLGFCGDREPQWKLERMNSLPAFILKPQYSYISLCFRIWIEEGCGNPLWQMDARIGLSYILTSLLYANCLQTFMANSSSFVYASFFAMQKMVWHFAKYSAEIQTLSNYSEKAVWASMTTRQTVATKLRGVD